MFTKSTSLILIPSIKSNLNPSHFHLNSHTPNLPMAVTQKSTAAAGDKKPKSTPSHPPYLVMIKEAIIALKDRSGSSQIAIAKHIESNYASKLPQNFKKHLLIQIKKLVANEKLVKIKNSYKLAPVQKPSKSDVEKKKTKEKKEATKTKMVKIADIVSPAKRIKKVVTKSVKSPMKKTKSVKSPMKKTKSIKSPVKKVKSIKSPMKKKGVTAK